MVWENTGGTSSTPEYALSSAPVATLRSGAHLDRAADYADCKRESRQAYPGRTNNSSEFVDASDTHAT
jgi:hypothetical protein